METCFIINRETWARREIDEGEEEGEKEETRHGDCFARLEMGAYSAEALGL